MLAPDLSLVTDFQGFSYGPAVLCGLRLCRNVVSLLTIAKPGRAVHLSGKAQKDPSFPLPVCRRAAAPEHGAQPRAGGCRSLRGQCQRGTAVPAKQQSRCVWQGPALSSRLRSSSSQQQHGEDVGITPAAWGWCDCPPLRLHTR